MKLKKTAVVLLLVLIVMGLILPIPAGFLKKDIKNQFKRNGYILENIDVSIKLPGKIILKNIKMKNHNCDILTAKKVTLEGSLLKMRGFKKRVSEIKLSKENFSKEISKPIKKVLIKDASLQSFSSFFGFTNVNGTFKFSSKKISGDLTLEAAVYDVYKLGKQNVKLKFTQNDLSINLSKGEFANGKIEGEGVLNFVDTTVSNIKFKGKNLSLSDIANSDKISGNVTLNFEGEKFIINEVKLFGEGKVLVKEFKEDGYRDLKAAKRSFKLMGINSINFDKITFPFVSSGDSLITELVVAKRDDVEVSGSGYTRIKDSYFNFKINGELDGSLEKEVSPVIWDALLPLENGGKSFNGKVRGVPSNYTVSVDKKLMKRSINSFFNKMFN